MQRIPVFMRSRYQWNNNDRHGIVRKRVRVIILELMGIHAHCWNTVTGIDRKKKKKKSRSKRQEEEIAFLSNVLLITAQIKKKKKKKNRFENSEFHWFCIMSTRMIYSSPSISLSVSLFFFFYIDEHCN